MKLSDFELDVMQYFWMYGQGTSSAAWAHVKENRSVKYTTVKTIIGRLERKSALIRSGREGRSIVYAPTVSQQSVTHGALPSLLRRFFSADSRALIAEVIEGGDLSQEDLKYLKSIIAKQENHVDIEPPASDTINANMHSESQTTK